MTSPEIPSSRCLNCGVEFGAPHAAGCQNASNVAEHDDTSAIKKELESFAGGNSEQYLSSLEAALRSEIELGKKKWNFMPAVIVQIAERAFFLFYSTSIHDAQTALIVKRHVTEVAFDITKKILPEVFADHPTLLAASQRMLAKKRENVIPKIFDRDQTSPGSKSSEITSLFTEEERLRQMVEIAAEHEEKLKLRFGQPVGKKFLHHSLMTSGYGPLSSDSFYHIAQQGIQTQEQLRVRGVDASGVGLQGARVVSVLPDTHSSWVLDGFRGSGQDPLLTLIIEPTVIKERIEPAKHIGAVPGESYIKDGVDPIEIVGVFVTSNIAEYIQKFLALSPDEQAQVRKQDMAKMLLGNTDRDVMARGLVHAFYNRPDLSRPIYHAAQNSDVPYIAEDGAQLFGEIQKRRIFPPEIVHIFDKPRIAKK